MPAPFDEHLAYIQRLYEHTDLTPQQVARVLHGEGKDTKKRIEQVRSELDQGTLVPGLKKNPGKHWRVDAVKLAKALASRNNGMLGAYHDRPDTRQAPSSGKSRFKNPGRRLPRFLVEGSHLVWAEVLEEMLRLESEALQSALSGEVTPMPDRPSGDPTIIF